MIEYPDNENYTCIFDIESGLVTITYRGTVSPKVTHAVYTWMMDTLGKIEDVSIIRGCIFDFRAVNIFDAANLSTARRESLNFKRDQETFVERIPALLIVETTYQETMVRTSMKLAQQTEQGDMPRVKMVKSVEEAHLYIDAWHAFHGRNGNESNSTTIQSVDGSDSLK